VKITAGTASTEWPESLKWMIILGSFFIMISYFVVYPFIVAKRTNFDETLVDKPTYITHSKMQFFKIRDFGELFSDSILLFSKGISSSVKMLVITVPLFIVGTVYYYNSNLYGNAELDWSQNMEMAFSFDYNNFSILYFSLLILTIGLSITNSYFQVYKKIIVEISTKEKVLFYLKNTSIVLPVLIVLNLGLGLMPGLLSFVCILILPFLIMPLTFSILENKTIFKSLGSGLTFAKNSWGVSIGITAVMLILLIPILLLGITPLEWLVGMVLDWFLLPLAEDYFLIKNCIWAVVYYAFVSLLLNVIFVAYSLTYFSVKEREEAISLKKELSMFGTKSKTYESEEEGAY